MVAIIKRFKVVILYYLLSPVLCWAQVDYTSIYKETLGDGAILIDARQGVQSGELSVNGSHWISWPQTTQELPQVFDHLSKCLKGKKVYVFCYVGSWAGFVTDQLSSRGIEAVNTGGYSDWELAEVPMASLSNHNLQQQCN